MSADFVAFVSCAWRPNGARPRNPPRVRCEDPGENARSGQPGKETMSANSSNGQQRGQSTGHGSKINIITGMYTKY